MKKQSAASPKLPKQKTSIQSIISSARNMVEDTQLTPVRKRSKHAQLSI